MRAEARTAAFDGRGWGAIGVDRNSIAETVAIAERNADVYAAVGVHPHDAKDCDAAAHRLQLRDLAGSSASRRDRRDRLLDFHYMHSPMEAQEAALRRQLELAAEVNRPIVIHCRDARRRDWWRNRARSRDASRGG